jgi:hypothetical protein
MPLDKHTQSLYEALPRNRRAPKLRFQPGEFYREKKTGVLYCVIFAYLSAEEPTVWRALLEERRDLTTPESLYTAALEELGGFQDVSRISYLLWDRRLTPGTYLFALGRFAHGDSTSVPTSVLLRDFTLVSSGEIMA